MRNRLLFMTLFGMAFWGCISQNVEAQGNTVSMITLNEISVNTKISDVQSDVDLGSWGRLLFPVDEGYYSGNTLGSLRLTWYSHINAGKTVEIVRYIKEETLSGSKVFYDIYTDEEKKTDPAKNDTGLFYFRGRQNAKFAICNAGGGFAYVGAMHDSLPHALELSKKGYNAFALIYRPGWRTAMEDLARAIAFIHDNAVELQVDTRCYSLWGGSAGARMAAYLGSYGTEMYCRKTYLRPGAVIMQYTGHTEWMPTDPPTFACVGDSDGIADWRTVKARIDAMHDAGIPTEFHCTADSDTDLVWDRTLSPKAGLIRQ